MWKSLLLLAVLANILYIVSAKPGDKKNKKEEDTILTATVDANSLADAEAAIAGAGNTNASANAGAAASASITAIIKHFHHTIKKCAKHEKFVKCPDKICEPQLCAHVGTQMCSSSHEDHYQHENESKESSNSTKKCSGPAACICAEGYARNDEGACIPIDKCPGCGGDKNATLGCGINCNRRCSNYNKNVACPELDICIEGSCDCKEGYVLDDIINKCVLPVDCPDLPDPEGGKGIPEDESEEEASACDNCKGDCKSGENSGDGSEECQPAQDMPKPEPSEEDAELCTAKDLHSKPGCDKKCKRRCPTDAPCKIKCTGKRCKCKKGYLWNATSMKCVLPKECARKPTKPTGDNVGSEDDQAMKEMAKMKQMCMKKDANSIPGCDKSCKNRCPTSMACDPKCAKNSCKCKSGYKYSMKMKKCVLSSKCEPMTKPKPTTDPEAEKGAAPVGKPKKNDKCGGICKCGTKAAMKFVKANIALTFRTLADLTLKSKKGSQGVVVSGSSILLLLGNLRLKAKGKLAKELDTVLMKLTTKELQCILPKLNADLTSAFPGSELKTVSTLVSDDDCAFTDTFSSLLGGVLKEKPKSLDLKKPESSDVINEVVSKVTGLQNFVTPRILFTKKGILLIDAQTFKGVFEKPFDPKKTKKLDFTKLDGKKEKRPTMNQREKFLYTESKLLNAQVLRMKYKDSPFSLTVYLPYKQRGLIDLLRRLMVPDAVLMSIAKLKPTTVNVFLPVIVGQGNSSLKKSLSGILGSLFKGNKGGLLGVVECLLALVGDVLQRLLMTVSETGSGSLEGIIPKLLDTVDELLDGLTNDAVPNLLDGLLKDGDLVGSLKGLLGDLNDGIVPELLENLVGDDGVLTQLLGDTGAVPDLLDNLLDPEDGDVTELLDSLLNPDGGAVPELLDDLLGGSGRPAIPNLLDNLLNGKDGKEGAVPELLDNLLNSDDGTVPELLDDLLGGGGGGGGGEGGGTAVGDFVPGGSGPKTFRANHPFVYSLCFHETVIMTGVVL